MKKLIVILAIVGTLAAVSLGIAFAQTTTPPTLPSTGQSWIDDMIDYCQSQGGNMMDGDMMNGWNGGGTMGGNMMGGAGGYGFHSGLGNTVTLQRVASTLGVSQADLQTSLSKGETIAQIAQTRNIDRKLVVDTILAPQSEILKGQVKYGYLTEAQATAILDNAKLRTEQAIERPFYGSGVPSTTPGNTDSRTGPGYSGGYGRGMMGGSWSGQGIMGGGMMGSGGGRGMMGW